MSAPKQLAKCQRLERKRRRKHAALRRRQESQRAALRSGDPPNDLAFVSGPIGGAKMSTVLEDFVGPMIDAADGYREYSTAISMGVVAWNAALLPAEQRAAFVDSMLDAVMKKATQQERRACHGLIDALIARKLQHFANYHRLILSYQLDELEDGGFYHSVASALC